MKCQHSLRHYWNFLVNLRGKKIKHRRWSGNSTLKLLRIKAGAGNVNTSQTQPFPPVPSAPPRPPSACFLGRNSGRPRRAPFVKPAYQTTSIFHSFFRQNIPSTHLLYCFTATPSSTFVPLSWNHQFWRNHTSGENVGHARGNQFLQEMHPLLLKPKQNPHPPRQSWALEAGEEPWSGYPRPL